MASATRRALPGIDVLADAAGQGSMMCIALFCAMASPGPISIGSRRERLSWQAQRPSIKAAPSASRSLHRRIANPLAFHNVAASPGRALRRRPGRATEQEAVDVVGHGGLIERRAQALAGAGRPDEM